MEIIVNLVFYSIKVVVFGAIAYTGIVLGKKYRDKKNLESSN